MLISKELLDRDAQPSNLQGFMSNDARKLTLSDNEVHVWRVRLDRDEAYLDNLKGLLSVDELTRANRFFRQTDRDRFTVARGELRRLLSAYIQTEPHLLRFTYNEYGKPALSLESGGTDISFNLAHSQGVALYAVTRGRDIGVDVEMIRTDLDYDEIARSYFSLSEQSYLGALPFHLKPAAFFACWTRKEAFIKAKGLGVSFPLDQFSVCPNPDSLTDLLKSCDEPGEVSRWSLQAITLDNAYPAAVCVAGKDWLLKLDDWNLSV